MLRTLSNLASAAADHAASYVDIVALDLETAKQGLIRSVTALAIAALSAVFAVLLACIWIIAYFWDTPSRLTAIGGLTLAFVVICLGAGWSVWQAKRSATPILAGTRREIARDREAFG